MVAEAPIGTHERLAVVVSDAVRDDEVCFTGLTTGTATATYGTLLPVFGMMLAQRLHAPNLTILMAGWCQNPSPGALTRLPTAEFASELLGVDCEAQSTEYPWTFSIRRGDVDVGFSSAAQVDRMGNLNSVSIGPYERPAVRLVGPILQPEHLALFGREIIMVPRHERRVLVDAVDFVSGVGFPGGREGRKKLGLPGKGPSLVVTPKCVFDFDEVGAMRVRSVHPGVDENDLRGSTGFELGDLKDVPVTRDPTTEELGILRREIDTTGLLR